MKIAFVTTKEPHMVFGQLGLEIMGTLLKQRGHEVMGICDDTFDSSPRISRCEKKNLAILSRFQPDFVGFSVLTHRYQWSLKFANLIKSQFPSSRIIFGGPHATAVPEVVAREGVVDHVIVGEGEYAIQELIEQPDRRDIFNVYPNPLRPLIQDLDGLPYPDKMIWVPQAVKKESFQNYLIMASRGCPFRCVFCFNSALQDIYRGLGKYVRYRSVDNVISELRMAKRLYGIRFVLLMDDNFTLIPNWLEEFSEKYRKEINVPYACNSNPRVMTEDRIIALKQSRCQFVMLGLQTGNDHARRHIINRAETNREVKAMAELCHKHDLKFSFDHIFGVKGVDTPEILRETANFYNEVRPFSISTYRLYPLPKTPIVEQSDLSPEYRDQMNRGQHHTLTIRATREPEYVKYRNLFALLPLLPQPVVAKLIESGRMMNMMGKLPDLAVWGAKAFTNLKGGDARLVGEYLSSLPRIIAQRLRSYRGEFATPNKISGFPMEK